MQPSRTGGARSHVASDTKRMEPSEHLLATFSNALADTSERAGRFTVAVDARRRVGSSGFYVRENLVVTADHSIEDDDEIDVTFADGETLRGVLTARDPLVDIAVLRVGRDAPVQPQAIAESSVRPGALAIALARDDDGDLTVALGSIATAGAAWRTWRGGEIDRWIRPDIALSPRFSGGPLVDAEGRLIGMNTWGLSRRGALTVPTATLERIVDAAASGRRTGRGYLGLALQEIRLAERIAREAGIDETRAVMVLDVENGGPGDRAGILVGDAIIAIDAHRIEGTDELAARLARAAIASSITLTLLRGGKRTTLDIVVEERPR